MEKKSCNLTYELNKKREIIQDFKILNKTISFYTKRNCFFKKKKNVFIQEMSLDNFINE